MPTTVTEVATYTSTISYPNPTEGASGPGILGLFIQGLTNRTAYFKNLLETVGIVRRRYQANLTGLKGIGAGSRADTDMVEVAGLGMYQFVAAAADATDEPWIVVPASGSGRWYHSLKDIRAGYTGAKGLASLNAAGRLNELSQQQIMGSFSYDDTTGGDLKITSSTAFVDAGIDISVGSTAVGDHLKVYWKFRQQITAPETCSVQIYVTEAGGGGTTAHLIQTLGEVPVLTGGDTQNRWAGSVRYVCTNGGATHVKIEIKTSSGSIPAKLQGPGSLWVDWVRP